MRLVLLYHADTDDSRGRCIGRTEVPLSAQGRRRMEDLAADWPYPSPQRLIASERKRAHLALAPFARRFGRLPQVDARLDEQDFGDWDGRRWAELQGEQPAAVQHWLGDWATRAPPRGESFADVSRRAESWLQDLVADTGPEELVLVSAHAGPIRALVCHALAVPLEHGLLMRLDAGHVCALKRARGRFELCYFNASQFEANLFGDEP